MIAHAAFGAPLTFGCTGGAYPVTTPLDAVGGTRAGVLDCDLRATALAMPRDLCRQEALHDTWAESASSAATQAFVVGLAQNLCFRRFAPPKNGRSTRSSNSGEFVQMNDA